MSKHRQVVLIGLSGHGHVCLQALRDSDTPVVGYADREAKSDAPYNVPYLGHEDDLPQDLLDQASYFIGIGDNRIRQKVYERMQGRMAASQLATQSHSYLAPGVETNPLGLVAAGAIIQVRVRLGMGVIINTSASVDHDCLIGDFAHVAPGAVLAGNVHVGKCAMIGANATVLPGLSVGDGAVLGAGSVLLQDLPAGEIWAGNPAGRIDRKV